MSQIKFRGFSILFGKWIYGQGLKYDKKGKVFIFVDTGWYEVHKGSEAQFIGLIDFNETEVYENDIVKFFEDYNSRVVFKNNGYYLETNGTYDFLGVLYGTLEVIGNTFENEELLNQNLL